MRKIRRDSSASNKLNFSNSSVGMCYCNVRGIMRRGESSPGQHVVLSGSMHPFNRTNRHGSPHKSPSRQTRDQRNGAERGERENEREEGEKSRKTSPNRRKELLDARYDESLKQSACPGERTQRRAQNALLAKEMALLSGTVSDAEEPERLGTNVNNIIAESLNSERR